MITRPEIMEGIRRHIQPIGGQENLNILEVEPGHVRLSIELTEACLNLYGIAAGMSTYACEVTNVTQCAGINFVRGVNSGTIYVESNIVHKGRHTAVCRVDITGEEEELLATGNFTMFLGKEI